MKNLLSRAAAIIGASLLAGSVLASPAMAASPADVSVPSTAVPAATTFDLSGYFIEQKEPNFEEITKNLSDEELALLKSGKPAVVYQEAETAEITKVEKESTVQTYALLPTSNCASTTVNACLYGAGGASVDYGFIGTGSLTGTWHNRGSYGSQNRTMRACSSTVCYATVAPKVKLKLSSPTTLKSVTVF
ncbi:hypothetical protein [Glutamicibacter nicotianae]|uniref:hypothetical protein n=1 Tax=Glutamicibacter nicotianae TaxID=37929 RepID=UPI0019574732|nr:hypothetical protein [Glutamicibacter nicotianae]MBM7768649.1 hypothetical protein [Glutamicibacter nicotianae]